MKAIRLMLWLSLIGVTMMTITVSCAVKTSNKDKITIADDGSLNTDNTEWESASFFPYYIITMKESHNNLGESCYWLIYDDLDAGFDNEVVSMDEETYHIIHDMWKTYMGYSQYTDDLLRMPDLLRMMEDYEPIIYNNNGTAVLLLSDKDYMVNIKGIR